MLDFHTFPLRVNMHVSESIFLCIHQDRSITYIYIYHSMIIAVCISKLWVSLELRGTRSTTGRPMLGITSLIAACLDDFKRAAFLARYFQSDVCLYLHL